MVDVIEDLLRNLDAAALPLDTPDAQAARPMRERLVTQVRNHLLPRLRQVSAPVIVVVGGSTGAGKSTLVNSVVRDEVTQAGVLRPTTRVPVLVVHPKDNELLDGHPATSLATVTTSEDVPRGLALLDAPDLDSVHSGNRGLAAELVELADLWVFVTTGSRYGDALPWRRLRAASERGVSLAVVLNRVDRGALVRVRQDLFERIEGQGFGSVPLFVVPDIGPHEGVLAPDLVAELTSWLTVLGAQSQSRSVIARTVRGAWPALRQDVLSVAAALEVQRRTDLSLRNQLSAASHRPAAQVADDVRAGSAASGAPTTAWLAGASSGGALAPLVAGPANVFEAWRFRRTVAARSEAVLALRATCVDAARTLLEEAATAGERAVREVAGQTAAGAQVAALVEPTTSAAARTERLDRLFSEWEVVLASRCSPLQPVADDTGLDAGTLAALVECAAVGLDGAARAVARILGEPGSSVVGSMRTDLASWAAAAVAGEVEAFVSALDDLGVDHGSAATGLRLRASELKGYL